MDRDEFERLLREKQAEREAKQKAEEEKERNQKKVTKEKMNDARLVANKVFANQILDGGYTLGVQTGFGENNTPFLLFYATGNNIERGRITKQLVELSYVFGLGSEFYRVSFSKAANDVGYTESFDSSSLDETVDKLAMVFADVTSTAIVRDCPSIFD